MNAEVKIPEWLPGLVVIRADGGSVAGASPLFSGPKSMTVGTKIPSIA